MARLIRAACSAILLALLPGCFAVRPSKGGGRAAFPAPRHADPQSIALPPGYHVEAVARGLGLPTGRRVRRRGVGATPRFRSYEITDEQLSAITAYVAWLRKQR